MKEGRQPDAAQVKVLARELSSVGCPKDVAARLSAQATLYDRAAPDGEGDGWHDVLDICLFDNCRQADDYSAAEFVQAAEDLAEDLARLNAEAYDRQRRGESGWEPWWSLPGRAQRS